MIILSPPGRVWTRTDGMSVPRPRRDARGRGGGGGDQRGRRRPGRAGRDKRRPGSGVRVTVTFWFKSIIVIKMSPEYNHIIWDLCNPFFGDLCDIFLSLCKKSYLDEFKDCAIWKLSSSDKTKALGSSSLTIWWACSRKFVVRNRVREETDLHKWKSNFLVKESESSCQSWKTTFRRRKKLIHYGSIHNLSDSLSLSWH